MRCVAVREPRQADIARIRQRISRTAAELSYDIIAWIWGMLAAGLGHPRPFCRRGHAVHLPCGWPTAVCVLSPASGLLAGLYRGRHQRGSLDEVVGVSGAALATGACWPR